VKRHLTYLITGGARSGKSSYALELAKNAEKPFYIATGWAGDAEMSDRIRKHKMERGDHWTTIESKTDIKGSICAAVSSGADFIVVDCLTLWVSNMLMDESKYDPEKEIKELAAFVGAGINVPTVFVTNEVGSGIVPGDSLSRKFRDFAGYANRRIAESADRVVLTVCGIPMQIKPSSQERIQE